MTTVERGLSVFLLTVDMTEISAGRRGGCDGMFRGPRGSKGTQVMCAIHAKMPRGPQGSKVKELVDTLLRY